MPKKKGDVSIPIEQRLKWLRRYEDGESIFAIATDTGYDYRTVKKHIELAKTEKELKDERSIVLRNALERHFGDLLGIVEIMMARIEADKAVEFAGDEKFLWDALVAHIPRSPIWPLLRRWNLCVQDIAELKEKVRSNLDSTLSGDARLKAMNKRTTGQLFRGMVALLMFNAVERTQGLTGLDVKNLKKEKKTNGLLAAGCGAYQFGKIVESELDAVRQALEQIEQEIGGWGEFAELKDQYHLLEETRAKLSDELRILKWKRIIPGRCRLCPM